MIAIVSSTLQPGKKMSFYAYDERIEQTKFSLQCLRGQGFTRILLVDNSPKLSKEQLQNILGDFPEVEIHHILQYQFQNKGINEILMLLYLIDYLSPNEVIFKLNARYYPTQQFKKPDFIDMAVKRYRHNKRNSTISTRGYWVKDAATLHRFLIDCLYEYFSYSERIVGWRSLLRILFKKRNRDTSHFNISIEFAAENVLKKGDYNVTYLDAINIEGLIAGTDKSELISE